jgi:AAA+ ATPase superfamily predicted ATPase
MPRRHRSPATRRAATPHRRAGRKAKPTAANSASAGSGRQLVGREAEREILSRVLQSDQAELVAIYGRRRVGKTFLVREFFRDQLAFELTGAHETAIDQQLANFATALGQATGAAHRLAPPADWHEAFRQLTSYLETQLASGPAARRADGKVVVFFDELPWLASRRSGFLPALEHFWNAWASRQPNLVVVVCGSAASWMIHHVVQHRGGLHNRITRRMRLEPFTLAETEQFLKSRGVELDRRQVLELYMAMGGVPHYLKEVQPGRSAAQNIDAICFAPAGLLGDEFGNLYASLFEHAERHVRAIRALASKPAGMTRNELLAAAELPTGGALSDLLDELVEAGFVGRAVPYDKSRKDALYRLTDEYSLFYLKWIERNRSTGPDVWLKKHSSPAWRAWSGYAFENVCIKHIRQLKHALGIAGVETEEAGWVHRPVDRSDTGAQIDLLIDRRDYCINLCEMKFADGEFEIDKRCADDLRRKRDVFRRVIGTRKTVFLTLVTTVDVKDNAYRRELNVQPITMDALFT